MASPLSPHLLAVNVWRLLMIFVNNLDPDETPQYMGPDIGSICVTLRSYRSICKKEVYNLQKRKMITMKLYNFEREKKDEKISMYMYAVRAW